MLNTLKWLNVKQRQQLNTIVFIQKMKMGCALEYLTEQLRYVGEVQSYNLRNASDFRLSPADTNVMQTSLFSKGLYNTMPIDVKNEMNMNIFRKKTVNFIKHIFFDQSLPT